MKKQPATVALVLALLAVSLTAGVVINYPKDLPEKPTAQEAKGVIGITAVDMYAACMGNATRCQAYIGQSITGIVESVTIDYRGILNVQIEHQGNGLAFLSVFNVSHAAVANLNPGDVWHFTCQRFEINGPLLNCWQ